MTDNEVTQYYYNDLFPPLNVLLEMIACSAFFLLDSSYFYCIYTLFYNMQCHANIYKCD